jgi:hypothetical protein
MNEELTPEQKFAQDDPETLVPRELARGRTRDEIVADLVRLDWSEGAARATVDRIADEFERYTASPESRAQLVADKQKIRKIGFRALLVGLAYAAFGYFFDSMLNLYLGLFSAMLGLGGVLGSHRQLQRYQKYSPLLNEARDERNAQIGR